MTERDELIEQIAEYESRRTALVAKELRLHEAFMAAPQSEERQIGQRLDEVMGELDQLSDKIGCAEARLYLIESRNSRREFLEDAAIGGHNP